MRKNQVAIFVLSEFHKGLNKEMIVTSAKEMIEKDGVQQFSMRKLAEKLGIKTASLYTHIKSMEALFTEIGLAALNDQKESLLNAIGVLKEAAEMTTEPFMKILDDYHISADRKMHWQRVLRGVMHGFVSEEQVGYFSHYPVSMSESYAIAINCLIDGLHKEIVERKVL